MAIQCTTYSLQIFGLPRASYAVRRRRYCEHLNHTQTMYYDGWMVFFTTSINEISLWLWCCVFEMFVDKVHAPAAMWKR